MLLPKVITVNLTRIYLILLVYIRIPKRNFLYNGVIRSMMHGGFKLKWNDRLERNIFLGVYTWKAK